MKKLEIEQKFLLKSLPWDKQPDEIIEIDQFYLRKEGQWERARTWFSSTGDKCYIHTIKKSISKRVNIEDEKFLTKEEFETFKSICFEKTSESRFIHKKRHIYHDGDLKWEVDQFGNGYKLIVAEIELPNEDYQVIVPAFILDVMLLEVTGLKQFSNRTLALPIYDPARPQDVFPYGFR